MQNRFAVLFTTLAVASSAAFADYAEDVQKAASDAHALAHETVSALNKTPLPSFEQRSADMQALLKIDPTILYGNNPGLLGAAANAVLNNHYVAKQMTVICERATEEGDLGAKLDQAKTCLGQLRSLHEFRNVSMDVVRRQAILQRIITLQGQASASPVGPYSALDI